VLDTLERRIGKILEALAEHDDPLDGIARMADRLKDTMDAQAFAMAAVSGMAAVKARSANSGWARFYWFRPAQPQEVAWAGNPDKPTVEKAGVAMLSPRRSFEKWIEVKTGYSRPWTIEEKITAGKFRSILLEWL
jgi:two-component system, chemotaxis family, sensor kinase Cph1